MSRGSAAARPPRRSGFAASTFLGLLLVAGSGLALAELSDASGGPTITSFGASPTSLVLGNSTTIAVSATGGVGTLTYNYTSLPPGCLGSNGPSVSCAPTRSGPYVLSVLVTDGDGSSTSATANLSVAAVGVGTSGPEITSFGATPDPVSIETSTEIAVAAQGGVGGLSYSYPELPPGCSTDNASSILCSPTSNGTFAIYALVTDAAGHRAGVVGSVTVGSGSLPAPAIASFSAAPERLHLGGGTTLSAVVLGGVPPLSFIYTELPAGCSGDDVASVSCTPQQTGNFSVELQVTDALGRAARSTAHVLVLPALPTTSVPSGPSGASGLAEFESPVGAGSVAFVGAAALAVAMVESGLRQRRLKAEGEAIGRALRPEPPPDPPGG